MKISNRNKDLAPNRKRAVLALLAALTLIPLSTSAVYAQTGISEADVIQEETEEEAVEDAAVDITERDALSTRPTVNITAPGVDNLGEEDEGIFKGEYVQFKLSAVSRFFGVNNVDFRSLSDTDDNVQDQFDSDDRRVYGANNVVGNITFMPTDTLDFHVGLRHNSLWGGGKFFNLNSDNVLFMDNLFMEWTPVDTESFSLTARIGRQYFEIGGAGEFGGAKRDYFFWDVVDGLTVDVGFGAAGKLRILGMDFAGAQYRPDEVDFYTRQTTPTAYTNFRGQAATQRYGAIYENTEAVDGLEFRAFGFYSDIGAGSNRAIGTAADLCYAGALCNFTDNDYNWMAGSRVGYFLESDTAEFGVYGEYARSGGVDRRRTDLGLRDITSDGNAFGGGLSGGIELGSLSLGGAFQYFRADGASYGSNDGIQFNHGFVGFKGAHVGGGIADDTLGWHPSAYVSATNGVDQTPQDQQRKGGTQSIFAGLELGIMDKADLTAGVWLLQDTGSGGLSDEEIDAKSGDLPFGYSQADFIAQQRLGKSLGTELDLGLSVKADDRINIFGQGGLFLPGEFYNTEISRTGGTALGSDNPVNAWMVSGGISIEMD